MYARVSRYQVPVEKLDEDVSGADATAAKVADMPGSAGLYYLVDRHTGKTMAITLWDSEEAMRASEEAASDLREETASAASATVVSIDRFEVVEQPTGAAGR